MNDNRSIDQYLAACVRAALCHTRAPEWPALLAERQQAIARRIDFHGLPLLFVDCEVFEGGWPDAGAPESIHRHIQSEARQQAVWEASHAQTSATLIEALHARSVASFVMKGTALAYSVYGNPAVRRRGDTDLLIAAENKGRARNVLRECGFEPVGDKRALQESWALRAGKSFLHEVDVHWDLSASPAVSAALNLDHPSFRSVSLPRLSPSARAFGPIDNVIHICINRAAHARFGYLSAGETICDGDRLIWAVDLYLLTQSFSGGDWDDLISIARSVGASLLVADALDFADQSVGLDYPAEVRSALVKSNPDSEPITSYFTTRSARTRFWQDYAEASSSSVRLGLLRQHLWPGPDFLRAKYPALRSRSLGYLRGKRLLDTVRKMVSGRNA